MSDTDIVARDPETFIPSTILTIEPRTGRLLAECWLAFGVHEALAQHQEDLSMWEVVAGSLHRGVGETGLTITLALPRSAWDGGLHFRSN